MYIVLVLHHHDWTIKTITRLHGSKDQSQTRGMSANNSLQIILPFKDQKSADIVREDLHDLTIIINNKLQPVFSSMKIIDDLKVTETKPFLWSISNVLFTNLCDALWDVGFTCQRLSQRIAEHRKISSGTKETPWKTKSMKCSSLETRDQNLTLNRTTLLQNFLFKFP